MAEGDRYDPVSGHWTKISGPTRLFTDDQNKRALELIQGVLGHTISEADAHIGIDLLAAEASR